MKKIQWHIWVILIGLTVNIFGIKPEQKEALKEALVSEKQRDIEVARQRELNKGAAYLDTSLQVEKRVQDLVQRMTLEEKVDYLGGTGFISKVKIGETQSLTKYGLPIFKMTDASLGSKLTLDPVLFPSTIGLAATFNTNLAGDYGKAVAEQSKADGFRVLLGPGVNIYRIPHCGRNFEYMGEDPYLASRIVVAYIKALQSAGVMGTVKHYVANNSDYFRKKSNSVVSERALREIYFPAFKAAVQEADVKAVMTSYNLINGLWAAENKWLVTDVLRNEWGFDGLVMTDWWSVKNADLLATSGTNLEMPNGRLLSLKKLKPLLDNGTISEATIDERVSTSLRAFFEMGLADLPSQIDDSVRANWPQHAEVARQVAREALVLLKNDGILPLRRNQVKRIAVVGKNAAETTATGGGAAGFDPGDDFVTYLDAIQQSAGGTIAVEYYETPSDSIRDADLALVFITVNEAENSDRNFNLPSDTKKLILATADLNTNTVVVASCGGGVEMASWLDKVKGLVYTWYPGTYGAVALGEALFGELNPCGKLPITIEKRQEDSHYWGNYIENPNGLDNISEELKEALKKQDHYDMHYREGIMVGYRWYDTRSMEPLFHFGFGLSYTTFGLDDLKLSSDKMSGDESLKVACRVANTGALAGAEVVQLYIHDVESSVERPQKELKGFKKVTLDAGQSKQVEFTINKKDLAFWHPETKKWTTEAGQFEVRVGTSSGDIKLIGRFAYE